MTDKVKAHESVVKILAWGVISTLVLIVAGEIVHSHGTDNEVSAEIVTLVDKTMTAIVAAVAGYLGGSRHKGEKE